MLLLHLVLMLVVLYFGCGMNSGKLMKIIPMFIVTLFLCCGQKVERKQVLDKEKFVQIYCDVVSKADLLDSQKKEAFVDSILAHYGVTPDVFERTIQSYNESPDKWKELFDSIVKELEKRLQQIDTTKHRKVLPRITGK